MTEGFGGARAVTSAKPAPTRLRNPVLTSSVLAWLTKR